MEAALQRQCTTEQAQVTLPAQLHIHTLPVRLRGWRCTDGVLPGFVRVGFRIGQISRRREMGWVYR